MTRALSTATKTLLKSSLEDSAAPRKWVPLPYMKRAVKFLRDNAAAGLLLDPGMRKTSITLEAIRQLLSEGLMRGVLVIAPRRVCHLVWTGERGETKKWSNFAGLSIGLLRGSKREQVLVAKHDIYVINPESLPWLLAHSQLKKFLSHVDTLVVDELSKFKKTTGKRYQLLDAYLDHFARRWGLTGSPMPNNLLDLFGQVMLLDRGRGLGQRFWKWRQEYFIPVGYGGFTWVPKPGAEEVIYKRLRPLMLRMSAADYLEMPELVDDPIYIDLPDKVRKAYDEMEEDCFAFLGRSKLIAPNTGVALGKCRQLANGGVYTNILGEAGEILGRKTVHAHDEKTEALLDLIDELQGAPLLIAYEYNHDLARLLKALGKNLPYIGKGVSDKRVAEIERAWNEGRIPVMAGHPQSMGHGLNMQAAAQHVAWYALTYDYDLYDQMIRRVWRSGNTHQRVFCHQFVARNTVDEAILMSLSRKARSQGQFLEAMREYRLRRKSGSK